MTKRVYEKYDGSQVTDSMLQEAARLFSENYGVWGREAASVVGAFAKEGNHVKISKDRLRAQYLPENAVCSYVRVIVDGHLAGNAFACRWKYENRTVCWITQLVVHRNYRERGLAVGLLNELKESEDDVYGLMSSHPAACIAAARVFGNTINAVRLDFIKEHAEGIMKSSPISYVRAARPHGSLFNSGNTDGAVSSVDTNFFIDHTEPLEALASVRETMDWPLGELLDGHEYLIVFEVRHRSRSTSRPRPGS
ncbi:hypothetical protein VTN77DRAFT_9692 [Rasamsonia byssochlamydoides]|uniref:uncharacterized protein n=1 Tax=Rasamsonia byssochlamydoides TaxID=89139 RepID=UPI00374376FC